jgi:type IV pilus assembly protein PilO
MAISPTNFSNTLSGFSERIASQFQGLNPREPGQWPLLPKIAAWSAATLAVVVLGWLTILSTANDDLDHVREREPTLKQDYRTKLSQAVNLSELKKQKLQVQEYVTQLERQLPGKAEMDALLSDINQAGLGRGLQIEVFRPGQVEIKDYYAELPITVKVTGRYHDIGAFAADVANLSRIVTLHNLTIVATTRDAANGYLAMDAIARTYRYLDQGEVADMRRAASAAKSGAKK